MRERCKGVVEGGLGVVGGVVADQRRAVGEHADDRLLELHLDQPALGAKLDDVALDLVGGAEQQLAALQDGEHVVERDGAGELERRQAARDRVEAAAVLLERRQALVRLAEHGRDVLEDVLHPLLVEGDDVAAGRDRDDQRLRLLRDALGGAVAGAGLGRVDRRIRHQLDVRPGDLARIRVEDDRAVHLRHLVEQLRRVVDVETEPAGEQEGDLLRLAENDQAAGRGVNDVVDALAKRRARGDHVEGLEHPRVLTRLRVSLLVPGSRRHPAVQFGRPRELRGAAVESRVEGSDCRLSSADVFACKLRQRAAARRRRAVRAPRGACAQRLAQGPSGRQSGLALSRRGRRGSARARTCAPRRAGARGGRTPRSSPVSPISPKQASGQSSRIGRAARPPVPRRPRARPRGRRRARRRGRRRRR